MKVKKIILIGLGVVVVLIAVGLTLVVTQIDGIVKRTVEKQGTAQLDLATTLSDASVGLLSGQLTLSDLDIANPEGYTAPSLFSLGQVNVGVGYGDLMDEPIRIREITLNSPSLTIERGGTSLSDLGKINIRELLDRLSTEETAEEETEPVKLLIDQLTITAPSVVVKPNIEGLDETYALTLPDIQMNEIGTAEGSQNGAEIGRVVTEIIVAMAQKAAESEDLPPELRAALNGDLSAVFDEYAEKLGGQLQERLEKELGDLGGDLGDAARKALEGDTEGAIEQAGQEAGEKARDEIRRGIGGLLGGDDDDEDRPTTRPK